MHSYELRIQIQADVTVTAQTEDMARQIAEEMVFVEAEPVHKTQLIGQGLGWPEGVSVDLWSSDGVEIESIEQVDGEE